MFIKYKTTSFLVVEYFNELNSSSSSLGYTIDQIKPSYSDNGYVIFNDEPSNDIQSKITSENNPYKKSVSKGLLVYKTSGHFMNSGFHIKHSMPGFPIPITDQIIPTIGFKLPRTHPTSWLPTNDFFFLDDNTSSLENSFSHAYFCHSFINVETLVQSVLKVQRPYIYRTNVSPLNTSLVKDLFSNFQFTPPISSTIDGIEISISTGSVSMWENIEFTNWKSSPIRSQNIITEIQLPTEFSKKFSIPTSLTKWSTSIDKSHVGYMVIDGIPTKFCIGDFFNFYSPNSDYDDIETLICVSNNVLASFIKIIGSKLRKKNSQEVLIPTLRFQGLVQMNQGYNRNPFTNDPYLSNLYESMLPDFNLKNTKVGFFDGCPFYSQKGDVYPNISDTRILYTNDNGMLSINKNYKCGTKLFLNDRTLSFSIQRKLSNQIQEVSIPLIINETANCISPDYQAMNTIDSKLLFIYKTIQIMIPKLLQMTIPINNPPVSIFPITLFHDASNNELEIDGLPQIKIDLNNFNLDQVFKSFSYHLITRINSQYSVSYSLSNFEFDKVSIDKFTPVLRGLINTISMYLRQYVFPSLPLSNLQSLNSRNIEYFRSNDNLGEDIFSNIWKEGWVTSFLWDLVDDNQDSRMETLFYNDYNSISITSLLLSIQSNIVPSDGIIQFTNNTLSSSTDPIDKSFIDQLLIYNQLLYCPPSPIKCIPTINNPYNLNSQFTSRGICISDLELFGQMVLQDYVELWAGNYLKDNEEGMVDWTTNRLFSVLYNDNQFNQEKLKHLIPYLGSSDMIDCDLQIISNTTSSSSSYLITPKLMAIITKRLLELIALSNQYYSYQSHISVFYIPPISSSITTKGLVIATYYEKICNFGFYSSFSMDTAFELCTGIAPYISNVIGLSGSPSTHNPITIYGRNLMDTNVQVKFGEDGSCNQLLRYPSLSSTDDDMIICTTPKGYGRKTVSIYNINPPSLPAPYYSTEQQYEFVYHGPITEYLIYPPEVGSDLKLNTAGTMITIVGRNFIDRIENCHHQKVIIDDIEFPVTQCYQIDSKDYFRIFAQGVGSKQFLEVIVGSDSSSFQSNQSITLSISFKPPILTSISITNSPVLVPSGTRFLISGQYFAPTQTLAERSAFVFIGNVECTGLEFQDQFTMSFDLPVNVGKDRPVRVLIGDQFSENPSVLFTYDAPQLYQVLYQSIRTNETSQIWITGLNFGAKYGYIPQVSMSLSQNTSIYLDCYPYEFVDEDPVLVYNPIKDLDPQYNTTDFDSITCFVNEGYGHSFPFTVNVYNQVIDSTQVQFGNKKTISYDPPHLNEILPIEGPPTDGNTTIIFRGTGFVPNELLETLNERRTFVVEDEVPSPTVETLDNGIEHNNISITYKKHHLINDEYVLLENRFECTNLKWISSQDFNCTIKSGFGSKLNVSIYVGDQFMDNFGLGPFSYAKNKITPPSLIENIFPLGKQFNLTISGENFIPIDWVQRVQENPNLYKPENFVYIGSQGDEECVKVYWIDSKTVKCTIPLDSGANLKTSVLVGNLRSDPIAYYSFERPTITNLVPSRGRMSEKVNVTITGNNFGNLNMKPDPIVYFNQTSLRTCQPFTKIINIFDPNSNNTNQIICEIGEFSQEKNYTIQVELNGQISDPIIFEAYGKPKIEDVIPRSGSVDAGYDITLKGKNFLEEDRGDPQIFMMDTRALITRQSRNEIIFTSVPGGGNPQILLKLNGQSADTNLFYYTAPIINTIIPPSATTFQNIRINLVGTNLGLQTYKEHVSVKIDGVACYDLVVISSTSVTCLSPYRAIAGVVNTELSFYEQSSNHPFTFVDRPRPTPITGGGGGLPLLIALIGLIITMIMGIPFGVAVEKGGQGVAFASVTTISTHFTLATGAVVGTRMVGRVVGRIAPIALYSKNGSDELLDLELIKSTVSPLSSSLQEDRAKFALLSDSQISQSDNRISAIQIIQTDESYCLDRGEFYELSTTVTFLADAIADGEEYKNIILSGTFYGTANK
eukprot:gene8511-10464_t